MSKLGRSIHGTAPLFFRWERLRFTAGKVLADVDPATLPRKPCRFFWICHEALWPLLHVTKHHKAACGFCFVIRSAL